ncbi:hypothetical protein V501_07638, partial [Pseudogymnoascus sp. VKM F-4519 (FW-2642)]
QPAATPGPRTDTASAESTVYAIRYHPIGDARSVRGASFDVEAQHEAVPVVTGNEDSTSVSTSKSEGATSAPRPQQQQPPQGTWRIWSAIEALNPFARSRQRPPPEVSAMTVRRLPPPSRRRPEPTEEGGGKWDWDVLGKLEDFASKRAERVREIRGGGGGPEKLPVMRIPAPATRRVVPESVAVPDGESEAAASTWPLPSPAPLPPDPNPTSPVIDPDVQPPSPAPSPVQRVREAHEQAVARNVIMGGGSVTSGESATAASEHITLPFDLRTHPRALYKPENTKLLENLFPGTYELSTDGMFIYFLQTEMPPKPSPKSVAGLTPYFAPRMSRQYTPCLIGFQVPMRNRAIAESVVEGRDMVDWEPLFIIIRNYFRQVEISITEVMYWSNSVVVILQHRDINIRKLPWKVSNIGVFYRYEDEMDRPSTPQSRCETDTRLENQVQLQRLTPAKGRGTGEFFFLVASDTDLIEGSFKVTSF